MKLALIISAIVAAVQSMPVTDSSREVMATSNLTNITTSTINPTTVIMPVNSTVQPSIVNITSSSIQPNATSMVSSSTMHPSTTKMVTILPTNFTSTTEMPSYNNISCFSNEYRMKDLNATIVKNKLRIMINNMANYTKVFSNKELNATMSNPLICGIEIAHNNTDNTCKVRYGAFHKSYCDNSKNLNIICNHNTTCNKVVDCCQVNPPLADENCNMFFIKPVNDTKNTCMASNTSECYSLYNMTVMPTMVPTTKANDGSVISAVKLYLLMLISVAAPAININ